MTTKLENIADTISELDLKESDATTLFLQMQDWKKDYSRSYAGCMKIPGFKKLWDALEEAAYMGCDPMDDTDSFDRYIAGDR